MSRDAKWRGTGTQNFQIRVRISRAKTKETQRPFEPIRQGSTKKHCKKDGASREPPECPRRSGKLGKEKQPRARKEVTSPKKAFPERGLGLDDVEIPLDGTELEKENTQKEKKCSPRWVRRGGHTKHRLGRFIERNEKETATVPG